MIAWTILILLIVFISFLIALMFGNNLFSYLQEQQEKEANEELRQSTIPPLKNKQL